MAQAWPARLSLCLAPRSALRGSPAFGQAYGRGASLRIFRAPSSRRASRKSVAASFPEKRLLAAASFSERGAPDRHCCHVRALASGDSRPTEAAALKRSRAVGARLAMGAANSRKRGGTATDLPAGRRARGADNEFYMGSTARNSQPSWRIFRSEPFLPCNSKQTRLSAGDRASAERLGLAAFASD